MKHKIAENELLSELRSIADLLGEPPSKTEFEQYAPFSTNPYLERYGNWSNSLEAAGLNTPDLTYSVPKQDLLNDFERVGRKLGRTPTPTDINEHGNYGRSTYANAFGSWDNMVDVSSFKPWEMGSGEDHPAWKGGHEEYYGANWPEQREKALERDGHECCVCGMGPDRHTEEFGHALHVHHIIPVSNFDDYQAQNELQNLITLCLYCHRKCEGWNLRPDV